MGMDYIRRNYGNEYRRGARVEYSGVNPPTYGAIVGSDGHRLRIRLDGDQRVRSFHPTWELRVLDEGGSR